MSESHVTKNRKKNRTFGRITLIAAFSYVLMNSVSFASCDTNGACESDLSALLEAEENYINISSDQTKTASVSISVDGETIVGQSSSDDDNRRADVDLESVDIQVKFDGLGSERMLSVSTVGQKRLLTNGQAVNFEGYWNYPAWVDRAEVMVYPAIGDMGGQALSAPVAVIAMDENGNAEWTPDAGLRGDHVYVLRVYDNQNRFDETKPLPIVIEAGDEDLSQQVLDGKVAGRGFVEQSYTDKPSTYNQNRLAKKGIPVNGGMVTVYGRHVPEGLEVEVMGRRVPIASGRDFVTQTILPAGDHVVEVRVAEHDNKHSIEFERDIYVPDSEWFYVGLADLTIGKRFGKDSNLLSPAKPGEYNPVYTKGRAAFYLKGKVKGKYIITAALDTQEEDLDTLFSNLDKKDPRRLLRRLDPDDYYPVYGDDSIIKEDAPTSGKFYVRIDRGASHVMWGNFKTRIDGVELARYERGLYGAKVNLESETATSFGEPVARAQAFAAQPGTLPQRDEYRGSGGSVYFLQRSDINQGSEQVTVELRDPVTGLVVQRTPLAEGSGYSIDYVQGVLILSEPLASSSISSSAVVSSSLSEYDQYVVVNYEYTPGIGEVDGYAFGGRAEAWLFDTVRLGATGYQDNTGSADHNLVGVDATWRLSEKSYFQLEWARSEGDNFASVVSSDGGMIFTPVSGEGVNGTAEAWRARLHLDMGEMTGGAMAGSFGVGYEERDKGFNAPGRYTSTDERILDAHLELKPSDNVSLKARFDQVDRKDGVSRRDAGGEVKVKLNDYVSVQAGVVHSDTQSSRSIADGTGERTDVGGRITLHGEGSNELYVFGQQTVSLDKTRRRNDRIGAGFKADIAEKYRVEGEVSDGTSGLSLLGALSYKPTASDKYYIGYRLVPGGDGGDFDYDPFGRDNGTIIAGTRRQLSDSVTAWLEHNYDLVGTSQGLVQAYGVELKPNNHWTVTSGVEIGTIIDENDSEFERIAPSLGVSYKDKGRDFGARLEARFENSDDNSRDRVTWLGRANLGLQYDDDWRFLAKIDAAISESDQSSTLNGDYIEASVGWAYRPVNSDKLNALFKYTYLHDLPGPQQVNGDGIVGGPKQRSHILSADFIYDVNEKLSIGGKYGFRIGEIATGRTSGDFVRSSAHLAVARADYHVVKNWDIMVEGRALWLPEIDQTHYGFLTGVYRHIGNNLKVGVGYNFGRFSDDVSDLTLDDGGVFLNVVGKI